MRDVQILVKPVFYSAIVLCTLAILQYITRELFTDTLLGIEFSKNPLISEARPRATSLFISPFDFGYISILFLIFLTYAHNRKWLTTVKLYTSIIVCSTNVILCGSRTVFLCLILSSLIYFLVRYNIIKNVGIAITALFLIVIGYSFIPSVQEKVDLMLSAFDMNSKVEGSSMTMRIKQYTATLYHIQDDMLFGRGYRYFLIDLGWAEGGKATLVDPDLEGLEGILMNYMLERGFFGVAVYIIFFIALFIYAYRQKYKSRFVSACSTATIMACICYGNMTGELGSTMPTLFMLGIYFKASFINIKSSKKLIKRKLNLNTHPSMSSSVPLYQS